MGAGLPSIVSLIAKNFVILVGISCLIAFPIAYYFMHKWLDIPLQRRFENKHVFIIGPGCIGDCIANGEFSIQ
jgi:hypothetical protein